METVSFLNALTRDTQSSSHCRVFEFSLPWFGILSAHPQPIQLFAWLTRALIQFSPCAGLPATLAKLAVTVTLAFVIFSATLSTI